MNFEDILSIHLYPIFKLLFGFMFMIIKKKNKKPLISNKGSGKLFFFLFCFCFIFLKIGYLMAGMVMELTRPVNTHTVPRYYHK